MTKRFLMILVILFWCNVGFAEVINYECKSLSNNQGNFIYLKYILNTDNNKLDMKWKLKDTSQVGSETFDIIKIDSESIEYKNYSRPDLESYLPVKDKVVAWFEGRGISQGTLNDLKVGQGPEYMPQTGKTAVPTFIVIYLRIHH